MEQNNDILNSWKEISQYVGRGVRTVQRWERDFGLPVRRPAGHVKSCVIALRAEIDRWMASRDLRNLNDQPNDGFTCQECEKLRAQIELLQQELTALRARCNEDGEALNPHPIPAQSLDSSHGAA